MCGNRPSPTSSRAVSRPASTRSVSTTATCRARCAGVSSEQIGAVEAHGAGERRLQAGRGAQERRLARAVGPDQTRSARRARRATPAPAARSATVPGAIADGKSPSMVEPVTCTAPANRRLRSSTAMTTGPPMSEVTTLSGTTSSAPGGWATIEQASSGERADERRHGQEQAMVGRAGDQPGEVRDGDADERDRPAERRDPAREQGGRRPAPPGARCARRRPCCARSPRPAGTR